MQKHKWHKEIKAWADGAEIEYRETIGNAKWVYLENPAWLEDDVEYRIKPQPKEPQYLLVYNINGEIKLCVPNGIMELPSSNPIIRKLGKIKLEVDDDTSRT